MKSLMVVLTMVMVLALLIGCAPQPAPTPTSSPKPAPTAAPASPTATAPAPAPAPAPPKVATPKYGGTLNVGMNVIPPGWDNHRRPTYTPFLGFPVFSNLIKFDPDQLELDPKNIIPDLAERWETSSDGKVWTFYLFKGVKWHDGKPLTADDVLFTFEKILDPKRSSIAGLFGMLEKFEKVDDFTVKAYLKYASPSFFLQLAGPFPNIQAKHLADVDWKTTAFLVGTGPFMFKNYVSGVQFQLVKNPNYHVKGMPYLDGVNLFTITDQSAQMSAIAVKSLDMAQPVLGVWSQENKEKLELLSKDLVWQQYSNSYGSVYWFNPKSEVLKDVRVRRALAMVMDRREATTVGFGGETWGEYDHAFLAPASGLMTDEINKLTGWGLTKDQRVVEAKKLMTAAGYASGFKMRFVVRNVINLTREASLFADVFKRNFNVDMEIVIREPTVVQDMKAKGDFDILMDDLLTYVNDPDEILAYFRTGNPVNFSGYSNPEVDKLIDTQSKEMDSAKRKALTQQIERILLTDMPAVPDAWRKYWHASQPYVKGFKLQNVGYGSRMAFERVWFDK